MIPILQKQEQMSSSPDQYSSIKEKPKILYYLTNFQLFSLPEADLLCNYKYFIENTIMKLGEDWRIQANLLTQQIISIKNKNQPNVDFSDFNLFNEFLAVYLVGKIGKEFQYTNYLESEIQEDFLEAVKGMFNEQKIEESLTFKTLSLGYCITATEVWHKTFKSPMESQMKNNTFELKSFAKLEVKPKQNKVSAEAIKSQNQSSFGTSTIIHKINAMDVKSDHPSQSENDMKSENKQEITVVKVKQKSEDKVAWLALADDYFSLESIQKLKHTLHKIEHKMSHTHILSHFITYVDELHLKNEQAQVRIISVCKEFYLQAFIVWLIFSIKMFFSLNFQDFLRYFKKLLGIHWKNNYERSLKKFQSIVEREWNKLLKDYTVALHDDQQVLHILINRVKKQIENEWESQLNILKEEFQKSPL